MGWPNPPVYCPTPPACTVPKPPRQCDKCWPLFPPVGEEPPVYCPRATGPPVQTPYPTDDCWESALFSDAGQLWINSRPNKHCFPEKNAFCSGGPFGAGCYQLYDLPPQFGCGGIRARLDCTDRPSLTSPLDGRAPRPALIEAAPEE